MKATTSQKGEDYLSMILPLPYLNLTKSHMQKSALFQEANILIVNGLINGLQRNNIIN